MKQYFIQTFGCQMNTADSEYMAACFEHAGCVPSKDARGADIVVINTCTVRDHAEHRALSYVGRLEPTAKEYPGRFYIFAGCAAERISEKRLKYTFPFITHVIGAQDLERFPMLIGNILGHSLAPAGAVLGSVASSPTALVTIMRGCNNYCSYCIVPYVRGRETSRPPEEIIEDVAARSAKGACEITLLGQNVNSYHASWKDGTPADFASLLYRVAKIDGIKRIRFMTSHPKDVSPRLIDAIAELPKVCPHLHLPLQSGSSRILQAMNRGYTAAQYRSLIDAVRRRLPALALTTDVIVGFPGETNEDFEQTCVLAQAVGYDNMYIFKYSSRKGTAAAALADDVPREEKERRHARLLDLANSMAQAKNATLIGTTVETLIEHLAHGRAQGTTPENKQVVITFTENDPAASFLAVGAICNVTITSSTITTLNGVLHRP